MHMVELQLGHGRFDQGHMGQVWWVKRSAKNTQALHSGLGFLHGRLKTQTQSLGTRKWLSKRASGEPTSSTR